MNFINRKNQLNSHYLLFGILVVSGAAWLFNLNPYDFPNREPIARDIFFSRNPISTILFDMKWIDQSPFYYVIQHLWKIFGERPIAVMSLNYVIQLGSLAAFFSMARVFFKSESAALRSALLFGLSPWSLWCVREARMYPLFILLIISTFLCIARYLDSRSKKWLFAAILVTTLNIYTHFLAFYIAALAGAWLFSEGIREWICRKEEKKSLQSGLKYLSPLLIFGGAVFILTLPQITRFLHLVSNARSPNPYSLSGAFFEAAQSALKFNFFNINNIEWISKPLLILFAGIFFFSMLLGFLKSSNRMRLFYVIFLMSVILLLNMTEDLDLRARYFAFVYPFLIGIACFGTVALNQNIAKTWLSNTLFFFLLVWSVFFFYHRANVELPERTKALETLLSTHHKKTSYYIGETSMLLNYTIEVNKFNSELVPQTIHPDVAYKRFTYAVLNRHDIVFYHKALHKNTVYEWMRRYLRHYRYDCKDRLFKRYRVTKCWYPKSKAKKVTPTTPLTLEDQTETSVIDWAIQKKEGESTSPFFTQILRTALVAMIEADGTGAEAKHFTYFGPKHGGMWALGFQKWQSVSSEKMTSGGEKKQMIWAHPYSKRKLFIYFPKVALTSELDVTYGLTDQAARRRDGAPVKMYVYSGKKKIASFVAENKPGWRTERIKLGHENMSYDDLTFVVETDNDRSRHFGFRFDPVDQDPMHFIMESHLPISLKTNKLSDLVNRLGIYRKTKERKFILPIVYDPLPLTAKQMHESSDLENVGGVKNRWVLGKNDWDTVAFTRQASGGSVRPGIWAHPKDETELFLVANVTGISEGIRGFAGFTDHTIQKSQARGAMEPVQFQLYLEDKLIFEKIYSKEIGWKSFEVPTNTDQGKMKVIIRSDKDKWSHFVFDLWSAGNE